MNLAGNLQYATSSWTPGGTILGLVIVVAAIFGARAIFKKRR